ncbi:MAG: nucleotidyl transferase AbiEii/AbiGii toxin family protein [Bacteroidota bacterium]
MLHTQTVTRETLELLKALMALEKLDQFSLVGGTNLSLRFGHRISIDLDLFTNQPFDAERTFQFLESKFPHIVMASQDENMLFTFINDVKVDMVLLPYPYIRKIENYDDIRLAAIEDIAAMKLSAIARRGVKKDFWDIAELLEHFSLSEMLEFYKKKYSFRDIFHLLRSLVYFEDAENQKDPQPLKNQTWSQVRKKVEQATKQYVEKHF